VPLALPVSRGNLTFRRVLREDEETAYWWPIRQPFLTAKVALAASPAAALAEPVARFNSATQPLGSELWQRRTAKRLGLESSLRGRGRPRKTAQKWNVLALR
jgi:hypothetical protein